MRCSKSLKVVSNYFVAAAVLAAVVIGVAPTQSFADIGDLNPTQRVAEKAKASSSDQTKKKSGTPYSQNLGPDIEGAKRSGTYIVTSHNQTRNARVMNKVTLSGVRVIHKFDSTVNGFTARLTSQQVQELRNDPNVGSVTRDKRARVLGTQDDPEWHLDRLDSNRRGYPYSYSFSKTGKGVKIYVVDTGVRTDHTELSGRIPRGFNAITNQTSGYDDCNGHGTHVAGLAAGMEYGAAKMATIIPVKVLNCAGYGSVSDIIRGLDWIKSDVATNPGPAVVNMSLGVEVDSTLDTAVESLITAGITVVAAAGNERANACTGMGALSPARVSNVITVGGLDEWEYENYDTGESSSKDAVWNWSNYGSCVDVYGPSERVTSAWNSGFNATERISGTSMASPLAAGVAALYLESNPLKTPAQVATAMVDASFKNVIDDRSYPLVDKTSFNNRALAVVNPPLNDVGDSRDLATPISTFWFDPYDEEQVGEVVLGLTDIEVTTENATYDGSDPDVASGTRTTWTRFVAPESGKLTMTSNSIGIGAGLYQGTPGGQLTKVGDIGALTVTGDIGTAPTERQVTKGQHYYVLFYAPTSVTRYIDFSLEVAGPSNSTISSAQAVSFAVPQTITGSNSLATRQNGFETDRNSVWFKFTVPSGSPKNLVLTTSESNFDTTLAITDSTGAVLTRNDNHGGVTWSRVSYSVEPGVTYWVSVGANDESDYGTLKVNISEVVSLPVNNMISSATSITGFPSTLTGSNVNADSELNEEDHVTGIGNGGGGCSKARPMCALQRAENTSTSGASVWWKFTATRNGRLSVNTTGSNFKTVLAVYKQYPDYWGDGTDYRQVLGTHCDESTVCGQGPTEVSFSVRSGSTYLVAVAGFAEPGSVPAEGSITLNVSDVTDLNPPANDMLANAIEIDVSNSGTINGTLADATSDSVASEQNVWYTFVAPVTGIAAFDLANDVYSMGLNGYVKRSGKLILRRGSYAQRFGLRLSVKAGERYYLEADADYQDSASAFSFTYSVISPRNPIVNDTHDLATSIDVASSASVSTSDDAYPSNSPLDLVSWHGSLYYTFTPAVSGPITFTATQSIQLGIYTGTEGSFVEFAKSNNYYEDDGYAGTLSANVSAGTAYTLVILKFERVGTLSWTALAPPTPVVVQTPEVPAPAPVVEPVPEIPAPIQAPIVTVPSVTSSNSSISNLLSSSAGTEVVITRMPSQNVATDAAVAQNKNKVTVALMTPVSKDKKAQIVKYTFVLKSAKGKAITKTVSAKPGRKVSTSLVGEKGSRHKLTVTALTKSGKKIVWNGPSITTPKK